jgi:hypothetical protein
MHEARDHGRKGSLAAGKDEIDPGSSAFDVFECVEEPMEPGDAHIVRGQGLDS